MLHNLTASVLGLSGIAAYILVAAVVFAEDAIFVGFVLPGETVAIIGGVLASFGRVNLYTMLAVVIIAAIVGDSVGYEIGRHFGVRILKLKLLQRQKPRLDKATDFLARRGGGAVFLGRFTAFFRAVMPALAGTARMPYPKFLVFNAAGGIVWGAAVVLAGYFAGQSYEKVARYLGTGSAIVVVAVIVVAFGVWELRKRRRSHREAPAAEPTATDGPDSDDSSPSTIGR